MRRFLSGEKLSEKINGSCSVRMRKLFLWLLITLSFVPAYLALFPGTFGYDAPVQAAQYFGEMEKRLSGQSHSRMPRSGFSAMKSSMGAPITSMTGADLS